VSQCGRLKASHPGAIVSVVTDDSDGSCSCWTECTASEDRFTIAAAVAVVKSSWGWDETDPIHVSINDKEIRVCARYDGSAWIVTDCDATGRRTAGWTGAAQASFQLFLQCYVPGPVIPNVRRTGR
jgi:hypothetical protein